MEWIEVSIKTTTEAVDAVSNILYESGAQGVSIEDPYDLEILKREDTYWDYIEEELEHRPQGAVVRAYFPENQLGGEDFLATIREKMERLSSFGISVGEGTVAVLRMEESQWENQWKQYYHPLHITEGIVIKPLWEEYIPKPHEVLIELDPGMAFGTGTHETTSMCIQAMEQYLKAGDTVLDIGCGSGILSILAAKLGAKKVRALDVDPVAVAVTKENIHQNQVENVVLVDCGVLEEEKKASYDLVVANIMADIILSLCPLVKEFVGENGIFISSGIIQSKKNEVQEELKNQGFAILQSFDEGEWCAIVAQKSGGPL